MTEPSPMTAANPVPSSTVWLLGVSQRVVWGISYYLIGVLGERMTADLGWSRAVIYGGFSVALVLQGIVSPWVGRAVDTHGGRPVMVTGSLVLAGSLAGLAAAHTVPAYYAAWIAMGVGMRMTLYDAAFAALVRIGGPLAKGPIAQITLLGGLASTTFWPIGHALEDALGWRGATLAYAGIALLTVPVHWGIARGQHLAASRPGLGTADTGGHAPPRPDWWLAAALYALIVTLTNFLNSGMSALMIGLLVSLGVGEAAAVWIATLRGVGQSLARLCEVLFGRRLDPLTLGVIATGLLPACFLAGYFSGHWMAAGMLFAFLYGAGNGLVTIFRGTAPLVLFDPSRYGSLLGKLLVPSFFCSALAPLVYAVVIERWGNAAALHLSTVVAAMALAAAFALWRRFRA